MGVGVNIGDTVSALALDCDGGDRVEGKLLDKRGALLLLDLPHGRWVFAEGARVLHGAAPKKKRSK